jgi:hypothetical protein
VKTNLRIKIATHILFPFRTIKHQICWWPPHLHVKYKLKRTPIVCLALDRSPHFLSLWRRAFLIRGEWHYSSWGKYTYLDHNRSYQTHFITACRYMCLGLLRVEMRWLAISWDEHLCRQVNDMCETAASCKKLRLESM